MFFVPAMMKEAEERFAKEDAPYEDSEVCFTSGGGSELI